MLRNLFSNLRKNINYLTNQHIYSFQRKIREREKRGREHKRNTISAVHYCTQNNSTHLFISSKFQQSLITSKLNIMHFQISPIVKWVLPQESNCKKMWMHLLCTRYILFTWHGIKRTLWVSSWWELRCCSARLAVICRKLPTSSTKLDFSNLWPIPWTIKTKCLTGTYTNDTRFKCID